MIGSGDAPDARSRAIGDCVRLVVLSDRRLFREALASSLGAATDCTVIGHAASIEDAVLLCRLCRPDTVLLDVGRGLSQGTENRSLLAELAALTRVVAIYELLSTAEAGVLRRRGVDTHVAMSGGLDALLEQLRPTEQAPPASDWSNLPGRLTSLEYQVLTQLGEGDTADTLARSLGVSVAAVTNAKRRVYRKMNVASQSQAVVLARALRIVAPPLRPRPDPARGMPPRLTPRESDILRSIALGHTVRQTARHLGIATKTVENTQARVFFKLGVRSRVTALTAALDWGLVESIGLAPASEPPRGACPET